MTCHKVLAYHGSNTSLILIIYHLQRAHPIYAFYFLTTIDYELIVNFQKVNY